VPVGRIQVAEMANQLNLSRTHLSRKLKEAEDLGSIGWNGRRGHSVMWVSRGFREEYARAQAVKLSIIDQAFELATQTRANGVGTKSILDRDAAA
jgi:DNA-binding transcriptional regulator GbsR (MarR family)